MSKYESLWVYIKGQGNSYILMSFDEIKNILGFEIDHSFLRYKKELILYGYQVSTISKNNKTVEFTKLS